MTCQSRKPHGACIGVTTVIPEPKTARPDRSGTESARATGRIARAGVPARGTPPGVGRQERTCAGSCLQGVIAQQRDVSCRASRRWLPYGLGAAVTWQGQVSDSRGGDGGEGRSPGASAFSRMMSSRTAARLIPSCRAMRSRRDKPSSLRRTDVGCLRGGGVGGGGMWCRSPHHSGARRAGSWIS